MDVLLRIKRLVLEGKVTFTNKAQHEMDVDELDPSEVVESLLNARRIEKTLRSRSPNRKFGGEKIYVIKSPSFDGTLIYTKGKIDRLEDQEIFYVLISSKVATHED